MGTARQGYMDLRDWMEDVAEMGKLKRVSGADCDLEIGTLTDLVCHSPRRNYLLLMLLNGLQP